jgi:predicted transcriptional regulator
MTFNYEESDELRFKQQVVRVAAYMADSQWRSLRAIAAALNLPVQSVSARLRDLRKERYGTHEVERRPLMKGVYEYRLIPNSEEMDRYREENK